MSTNTLNVYDPIFYANEALIQLEKALGMAGRVHRGYDEEHRAFGKGDVISIRRPSTFSAQNAPSAAQNLNTQKVNLTLDHWKEVKFTLTDKELTISDQRIISDHIRPAAYALADDVDGNLAGLALQCPWSYSITGTPTVPVITDLTGPYAIMFGNKVPMGDETMLHYMVDGTLQAAFQNLPAFNQVYAAGPDALATLQRGTLGRKFGFEVFGNQNVVSKTAGTIADKAGAVASAAGAAIGDTSMTVNALGADGESVKAGDTFIIAGNSQRYAVTADASVATNAMTVSFTPPLVAVAAQNAVVTFETSWAKVANLAFHRNFAALAVAPLSEMGNELGAKIGTVTDPITGLSLRSRLYYDGANSAVSVALDILYGYAVLDPNLACVCRE